MDKLLIALQEEIKLIVANDKEKAYLKKYQEMVITRCTHLSQQIAYIKSIDL